MKLSVLHIDGTPAIPGWTRVLGGLSTAYDSMFTAEDGWVIERVERGMYRLNREGMPAPVLIEGYGASYVEAEAEVHPFTGLSIEGENGPLDVVADATFSPLLEGVSSKLVKRKAKKHGRTKRHEAKAAKAPQGDASGEQETAPPAEEVSDG